MSEARNRFVLMQEVAELAVKHGGTVYGGYVRDFIIHEKACIEFYRQKNNPSQFEDVTVSPETIDRLVVPRDIDIHFQTRDESLAFERTLVDRSFRLFKRRKYGYGDGDDLTLNYAINLSLEMKLAVTTDSCASKTMLINNFRNLTKIIPGGDFTLDIIVCSDDKFPMNLDFECNGLVLTKNGIQLGKNLIMDLSPIGVFRRLQDVTDDILHKRARVVNLIEKRWKKMDERVGWEIFGFNVGKVKSETGDVCIICHDTLPMMYKLDCCNARYHKECLAKTFVSGFASQCIQCRCDVYMGEEQKKICLGG